MSLSHTCHSLPLVHLKKTALALVAAALPRTLALVSRNPKKSRTSAAHTAGQLCLRIAPFLVSSRTGATRHSNEVSTEMLTRHAYRITLARDASIELLTSRRTLQVALAFSEQSI
mmetsp:Transcript_95891/g.154718  ORF Transcript_95891/g.154718 Transcript_95891/m.154718 type:complete len:115 (-) Transcript_95891:993-1337(-)